MERRLAGILSADVVGYSRLMGTDEVGTLARLVACRKELIDPAIAAFHGHIIKLMGDGALVEFASIVDAIHFAIAIQRAMADFEPEIPDARHIRFRIGVNLGGVIIRDNDIYSLRPQPASMSGPTVSTIPRRRSSTCRTRCDGRLSGHLASLTAEAAQIARPPTANLEAYDNFLRGEQAARTGSLKDLRVALDFYQKADHLAPKFAEAFAADARTSAYIWRNVYDAVLSNRPTQLRA